MTEISSILPWSEPKTVQTGGGEKTLRTAAPTETFWAFWRENKETLKAAGVTCSKFKGDWQVCWWQGDPAAQQKRQNELKAKQDQERAEMERALSGLPAGLPAEQEQAMNQVAARCLGYQVPSVRRQVRALLDYGAALDSSDTGTGKTFVNLATCAVLGLRPFIVCPKAVMTSWKRAASHFGLTLAGVCNYELLRRGTTPAVKLDKNGKAEKFVWNLPADTVIIFDECHRCFPYDTLVETDCGLMTIGALVEESDVEKVASCNLSSGEIEWRRVTGRFKFDKSPLVKVIHEFGEIICTPDHKIWCANLGGWKEAGSLDSSDLLVLRECEDEAAEYESSAEVLQPEVFGQMACERPDSKEKISGVKTFAGAVEKSISGDAGGDAESEIKTASSGSETDAVQQSEQATGSEEKNCCKFSQPNVAFSWRQWSTNQAANSAVESVEPADGICNRNHAESGETISVAAEKLQGGLGDAGIESGGRSGRGITPDAEVEISRPAQGKDFGGSRVVGVESYESGSGNKSDSYGRKGENVYCIEVEGNHNFFADGILVSNCKDYKTLNCRMAVAALGQGYKVLGLSATAADNPLQMKFTALLTGLIRHEREFFGWMMRNGVQRGRFGMEFVGGRKEIHNIHRQIFPLRGTRIRIADLGDQFPETQITAEVYEMNGVAEEIQKAYDEMAAEIARIAASEAEDKGACILTEMLRARQRAEILKVPTIAEQVEDAVESGMSVAVFVNFDDSLDALAKKLGTKCIISGRQAGEQGAIERQANIDAFQADEEKIIICNIRAGGVGVSLHGSPTSRMRLSIIMPTWSGQDLKQALGRVWRAKGAKSIQRIFFAAGTIEEDVCKGVNDKIARIDVLNDGLADDVLKIGSEKNFKLEADERLAMRSIETPVQPTATTVELKQSRTTEKAQQVDALADRLTPAQIATAHSAMKQLAGLDGDRARQVNGIGFSGADTEFGHQLANSPTLSRRQAAHAVRLARKYRRQVGDLFPELFPNGDAE